MPKKRGVYGSKVNPEQFEELCSLMCTEQEICGVLGVSHDTLLRWIRQYYKNLEQPDVPLNFKQVFDIFSSNAKVSLRRIQFKQAETNPTMAIFLGKQYLGQKEVIEETSLQRIEVIDDVPEDDEFEDESEC